MNGIRQLWVRTSSICPMNSFVACVANLRKADCCIMVRANGIPANRCHAGRTVVSGVEMVSQSGKIPRCWRILDWHRAKQMPVNRLQMKSLLAPLSANSLIACRWRIAGFDQPMKTCSTCWRSKIRCRSMLIRAHSIRMPMKIVAASAGLWNAASADRWDSFCR